MPTVSLCLALLSLALGCAPTSEAKSAPTGSPEVQELKHRLTALSQKVAATGLYYDDDVRASIDAMPRALIEGMLPGEGFRDENASRPTPLNCTIDKLYGPVTECARSFMNVLRSYALFEKEQPSEFSGPPQWVEADEKITVVFDSHFYELEFRRPDLMLTVVRYRAQEE